MLRSAYAACTMMSHSLASYALTSPRTCLSWHLSGRAGWFKAGQEPFLRAASKTSAPATRQTDAPDT